MVASKAVHFSLGELEIEWLETQSERLNVSKSKVIQQLIHMAQSSKLVESNTEVVRQLKEFETFFRTELSGIVEIQNINFSNLRENLALSRQLLLVAKSIFRMSSTELFQLEKSFLSAPEAEKSFAEMDKFVKHRETILEEKIRNSEESLHD